MAVLLDSISISLHHPYIQHLMKIFLHSTEGTKLRGVGIKNFTFFCQRFVKLRQMNPIRRTGGGSKKFDGASSNRRSFEGEDVAFKAVVNLRGPLEPLGPTALPISKPRNFRVMRAHDMLGLGLVQRLIAELCSFGSEPCWRFQFRKRLGGLEF